MDCVDEPECPRDIDTPEEEYRETGHQGQSPREDQDSEVQFHPRHGGPRIGGGDDGPGPFLPQMGMPLRMNPDPYDGTGDWEEYQAYFEQLAYMHGWDRVTMAMVLGISLRGAARSVLTSFTLEQRKDYRSLVKALKQNFSPAQKVHTYLAELKCRKRKPNETLACLGRDIARLVRLAYPQADQATKDTIGINALLDALPGPAIETRLHILRGQPATLQEAVAFAMEVDSVIESTGMKAPVRRGQVNQVDSEGSDSAELKCLAEALKRLESKIESMKRDSRGNRPRRRDLSDVTCYNCGNKGHYKRDCKAPKNSGNEGGRRDPQ